MSEVCDHLTCTAPVVNGTPICHHQQAWQAAHHDNCRHQPVGICDDCYHGGTS